MAFGLSRLLRVAGAVEPTRSSGIPAAQQLWYISKAHLLELSEQGFWRCVAVQPATFAPLCTRHARGRPGKLTPISPCKAGIVPRPEPPWLIEPEEQTRMMVPVAEVTTLEMRHMTEPEHEVAIAELEHQTALAEVPEVSRLEPWDVSELGRKTTVAEVPQVTRLERTMPSEDATVVELEAMVSQVQLRRRVRREMARTEASVTCLGWLRRHCQCRHDSCEQHVFAHRGRSLIARAA
jgi:hypothetical protein